MAVRTTVTDVRLVIETALTDAQVLQHITDASGWVDRRLDGFCDDQTAGQLEMVERYLAAHLIQRADASTGTLKSAARADISETYQDTGDTEGHLKYAKIAAAQDPCGIVAEDWLGIRRMRYRVGTTYQADA